MPFVCPACLDCSLSVFSCYLSIHRGHNGVLHFGRDITMTIEQAMNQTTFSMFQKQYVTTGMLS